MKSRFIDRAILAIAVVFIGTIGFQLFSLFNLHRDLVINDVKIENLKEENEEMKTDLKTLDEAIRTLTIKVS